MASRLRQDGGTNNESVLSIKPLRLLDISVHNVHIGNDEKVPTLAPEVQFFDCVLDIPRDPTRREF